MNNSKINKNDIFKGIISIVIYLLSSVLLGIVLGLLKIDLNNISKNNLFIIEIIYELILLSIIILILKDTFFNNLKIYLKNIKNYLRKYIKYWFIALGIMYVCNFIIIIFTKGIAKNEESVRALFDLNPIVTIILGCVIAPILEELIFRLSIYKIIGKNKYLFIIVSGLLFGLAHTISSVSVWSDLLFIIPYSVPGIIFAYTLVDSDNIFVPISLHFIHNTFAFLLQIIVMILK